MRDYTVIKSLAKKDGKLARGANGLIEIRNIVEHEKERAEENKKAYERIILNYADCVDENMFERNVATKLIELACIKDRLEFIDMLLTVLNIRIGDRDLEEGGDK